MKRYADIVRTAKDPAAEAVGMVQHITGTQWCNVWSELSLLKKAMDNGGTLELPNFEGDGPGMVLRAEDLVAKLSGQLATMSEKIEGLRLAIKATAH